MIEQAADSVLRETSAIEKVLHQIGTHQEVDGVDLVAVGNALAPLILWREAVQEGVWQRRRGYRFLQKDDS